MTRVDGDTFAEYDALVRKVDEAVAAALRLAGDAVTCHAGCASCCVDGLSVLPVEAYAIVDAVSSTGLAALSTAEGACAFLDDHGRCRIYAARPLLCRTHGLPLRAREPARGLPIVDDVSVCALNFTTRAPTPAETLDAERLQALLTVVDRRFRALVGIAAADDARVPLRELAAQLVR